MDDRSFAFSKKYLKTMIKPLLLIAISSALLIVAGTTIAYGLTGSQSDKQLALLCGISILFAIEFLFILAFIAAYIYFHKFSLKLHSDRLSIARNNKIIRQLFIDDIQKIVRYFDSNGNFCKINILSNLGQLEISYFDDLQGIFDSLISKFEHGPEMTDDKIQDNKIEMNSKSLIILRKAAFFLFLYVAGIILASLIFIGLFFLISRFTGHDFVIITRIGGILIAAGALLFFVIRRFFKDD